VKSRLRDVIQTQRYDAIWLSRQLIIGGPSFEWLLKRPLIYDVDDAIYHVGNLSHIQFKLTCSRASAVIAGNDYIADNASKYCRNIHVIPTPVDTLRWRPSGQGRRTNYRHNVFAVGWSGTSSSYKYFIPIERDIVRFLNDYPDSQLTIMSDRYPSELQLLSPYVKFLKWRAEDEVSFVQSLDVGLMPISNDLWSRGKCSYKSLLYSACGVPVIISPFGMNKVVLDQMEVGLGPQSSNEWYDALRMLFEDRCIGEMMGANGVELVNRLYSIDACLPHLVAAFRSCV